MNTMFAQKCWESLFYVWPPRKYLEKMRSWGASQSAFYLWGCHLQPKHGIVTLQPSPLHQLKIKDQALKPQNKENRKWNLLSLFVTSVFFFSWWYDLWDLWDEKEEKRRGALYWNKTNQNPRPTKQDPTRFHPKSSKISKLIWITGQAMKKKYIRNPKNIDPNNKRIKQTQKK